MSQATPFSAIGITALGMVSALGRDVVTSCAAARAGLSAASELKVMDFGTQGLFGAETLDGPPTIVGHVVRGLADGFAGLGKALLLGAEALRDLQQSRNLSAAELLHTGMCVNLSDHAVQDADATGLREGGSASGATPVQIPSAVWKQRTSHFTTKLAEMAELPIPGTHHSVHHGGHAGLARAIHDAVAMVRAGRVSRCLVGGIDSRVEPAFVTAAARLRLLRTNENPVGLLPGEGAAFFLIEPTEGRRDANAGASVFLTSAVLDVDPVSLLSADAPTGAALARVLLGALEHDKAGGSSTWLVADMNGTERRAVEWGCALARLAQQNHPDDLPLWLPALTFGDTGAASGAMGLCAVVRAFIRGYAPARNAVIAMSSESGAKGALTLRTTT